MGAGRDGGEGELGEGLGDADDGFELADRDGDAGARVGGQLGRVHLAPDGDEVGREFFAGFGGEAGRAASACLLFQQGGGEKGKGDWMWGWAYDLQ